MKKSDILELLPPEKDTIIKIIENLLEKRISRKEVMIWQKELMAKYNYELFGGSNIPLDNDSGYWYFLTFFKICEKDDNKKNEYIIRDRDLREYLSMLKGEDIKLKNTLFNKMYTNMYKKEKVKFDWIISFNDTYNNSFNKSGIFYTRGIFDNLNDITESSWVLYKKEIPFFFRKSLNHDMGQAEIYGYFDMEKDVMLSLMEDLGINNYNHFHINSLFDNEQCTLFRLDDNNNQFKIGEYKSYIEANLVKKSFEIKNHKQMYFINSKARGKVSY